MVMYSVVKSSSQRVAPMKIEIMVLPRDSVQLPTSSFTDPQTYFCGVGTTLQ